ncbi:IQ domain-containing protein IQM6-like isoform X1 [Lycium barbarum]|uniref:IQ domain-containing protein IQM6-like isoform X1 n=1 Tax=Lycium barbarum TaxID=112863 RepID=UPI00293EF040|nr:IQ domain-containing protein IQM6-like isoform X1 [Lycium barbarum]
MEANQKPNSVGALLIPTIMQTPMPDSTVLLEDLLWRALDFATLRQSSVSFFDIAKTESVVSRWKRAKIWASKVGKGLSKDEKGQTLNYRHWLEAIDPRHRYGVNLNRYHEVWCNSESSQPFFYWLDFGDGKEAIAEKCSRSDLQSQCIKYLGPKEREAYEVTLKNGKFMYTKTGVYVDTVEGTKWMFVLSTSRTLYAGEKQRHHFHHSSFLAGGASLSSGRLVVSKGELEAIWAYSGHYRPTEEHFEEIITFLEEHHVDLTNVKKYAIDDDTVPKSKVSSLTNESKDDGTKNSTNEVIPHAA